MTVALVHSSGKVSWEQELVYITERDEMSMTSHRNDWLHGEKLKLKRYMWMRHWEWRRECTLHTAECTPVTTERGWLPTSLGGAASIPELHLCPPLQFLAIALNISISYGIAMNCAEVIGDTPWQFDLGPCMFSISFPHKLVSSAI